MPGETRHWYCSFYSHCFSQMAWTHYFEYKNSSLHIIENNVKQKNVLFTSSWRTSMFSSFSPISPWILAYLLPQAVKNFNDLPILIINFNVITHTVCSVEGDNCTCFQRMIFNDSFQHALGIIIYSLCFFSWPWQNTVKISCDYGPSENKTRSFKLSCSWWLLFKKFSLLVQDLY